MTDLARLVVALEAQSAKYQAELDRATKKLTRFEHDQRKVLGNIDRAIRGFGRGVGSILGGLFAGFSLAGVIRETQEAEEAMALLDNAVQATGGSAGYTTAQLAEMASELQRVTTFGDEAIMGAQQLLLRFQRIQGVNFERALGSALDLATVLRMDLQSAVQLVGKALEDPIRGMTQLQRYGITFPPEQKKIIKALLETGQQAQAQQLILQQLEARFDGAAEAARDTFGGALRALHNAAGDLLEAKSGLPAVTESLNELTDRLQDPLMQDGMDKLASGMLRIVGLAAEGASELGVFGDGLGRMAAQVAGNYDEMDRLEGQLNDIDRALNNSILGRPVKFLTKSREELEAMRKEVEASIEALRKSRDFGFFVPGDSGPTPKPVKPSEPIVIPVELEEINPIGERLAKADPLGDYLRQLDDQTKTALDKQIDFLNEFEANLTVLMMEGAISPEQYAERWGEALESVLQEVEPVGEKVGDKLLKQFEKVSVFWEQAFRNTTDVLAGFFENSMGGSFDNVLKDFGKMINAMVAQAIAAQIGEWLFGAGGKGGGALSSAFNFLGGLLPSRDGGGRGQAGQGYLIGRGAQPELFVPDEAGTFYPADQWMGRMGQVTQIFNVTGQVDRRTSKQMAQDAAAGQRRAALSMGG